MSTQGAIELPFRGKSVDLIGVPFDGMGRPDAQARAAMVLRAAGLRAAVGPRAVIHPDLPVSEPSADRGPVSGLLNETALLEMATALHERVGSSLRAGHFPFVYGADCSVLLGAVPALREAQGAAGLVFVDGHEDATPMDLSPNGEAANMEIALLTGLSGQDIPEPLGDWLPALSPEQIAMLGPRDESHRRPLAIPTVADQVWLRGPDAVSVDPAGRTREAVHHVASQSPGWWLHIDLDVLAHSEFAACGAPGEVPLPGGLTWPQLTTITARALRAGGCKGWSLAVYNPDLDPDGEAAASIIQFVAQVVRH